MVAFDTCLRGTARQHIDALQYLGICGSKIWSCPALGWCALKTSFSGHNQPFAIRRLLPKLWCWAQGYHHLCYIFSVAASQREDCVTERSAILMRHGMVILLSHNSSFWLLGEWLMLLAKHKGAGAFSCRSHAKSTRNILFCWGNGNPANVCVCLCLVSTPVFPNAVN